MRATAAEAEIIALKALGWVVGDPNSLALFVRASGIEPEALRTQAGSHEMACAILDFLLTHEALLLEFCGREEITPREIHRGRHLLDGP